MTRRESLSPDFSKALEAAGLKKYWSECTDSHQRQYLEWIESAKRAETRADRIHKAITMIAAKREEELKKAAKRSER